MSTWAPLKIFLASILCPGFYSPLKNHISEGPFKESESLLLDFLVIFVIVKAD